MSLTELESRTIEALLQIARFTEEMFDNAEMDGVTGFVTLGPDQYAEVQAWLECLDELPDDQPGVTMSGPARAEWALRNLRK